ncbi:DUF2760 domain-containing protein [Rubripirellula reticaptiva]|uniref:DUF2760 domain-containing protein n=1 Tax=Rubripirellula reticaptiva TaxID=2528013 RepID=A0A5C6EWQ5_9BACT|nr:DUF2760 domain-containing protein [Rubripirellula reticaptiva]TWU51671.1 hypothetical protein Poly59_32650 [Rubripirellula reticaptiva]
MGLGIALKAFSAALFDAQKSDQIAKLLAGEPIAASKPAALESPKQAEPTKPILPAKPARDSAVTLLATLQREARLIDLLQEDLGKYSDAQVGAAARPCLQQCGGTLRRLFEIKPLVDDAEGSTVVVGDSPSPMRYQWVGEGTAASGKLIHPGWQAAKVELPEWSGQAADANVIAPAQVKAN